MSKRNSKSISGYARRSKKQQQQITLGMIFGGVVFIALGLALVFGGSDSAEAKIDYNPEDIVSDTPFVAIHEMTPSTVSAINFLPKGGPQPEIAVSEAFFNFGSIGATEVARHDFIIANQGDAPLTIHRAYTTCGCTTAEFTSTVIPPGKVVVMTLVLDAGYHDVSGQTVRRGVIIENNDPNNPEIEIWTQAKVGNQ